MLYDAHNVKGDLTIIPYPKGGAIAIRSLWGDVSEQTASSFVGWSGDRSQLYGGTDFVYDDAGQPVDGTITSVVDSSQGHPKMSGIDWDISDLLETIASPSTEDDAAFGMSYFGGDDTIKTGSGSDRVDSGSGDDEIFGNKGKDELSGAGGSDLVRGGKGHDSLFGNKGADTLSGGLGNDTLTGGRGNDQFLFDAALSAKNHDVIVDFKHDDDVIALDAAIFSGIGASFRGRAFYAKEGAVEAHDRNDRVIYDTKSGNLYYDADGSREAHDAVLFATLGGIPKLDSADFLVV